MRCARLCVEVNVCACSFHVHRCCYDWLASLLSVYNTMAKVSGGFRDYGGAKTMSTN